ncbi:CHAT domain-containing protein [Streptomyces sp. NPDC093510]|uniref:CHAT domain-containing protein n=1 Tax=Streptomyces sp. NPDC093510 TaxID=3155199 RepID=UPI00342D560B
MSKELVADVIQNPSLDFTALPPRQRRPESPARTKEPLDLVVMLRQHDKLLHISAIIPGRRTPKNGTAHAYLTVTADDILQKAARLRTVWRDRLVRHQLCDADGMPLGAHPFSDTVDLSAHAKPSQRLTDDLADEGQHLLEELLAGAGEQISSFRAFLMNVLASEEGLRITFDSDLHLPWPMLAVELSGGADPRHGFLGYRHQVEQTGASAYPAAAPASAIDRHLPATSLNTDSTLDNVGRAADVRKLLEERSQLTVRTESETLLDDLAAPLLTDDVMYFWCHGAFVDNGSPHPHLAVRLSDERPIDGDLVLRMRRRHRGSADALFHPFVLLNACHTGQTAPGPGLKHLGGVLVNLGADGVLGPQIEIPQLFASEYALAFLDRYLGGDSTAGEIAMALAREYTDDFHNPLALAYSLYCGIDSRLETAL